MPYPSRTASRPTQQFCTVHTRSFLVVKQWRHGADHPSPFSTHVMNWLELYLVIIRWRFFYTHNNGTYSCFLFQSLWMDWENQKHGLVLMSMKTSQVSQNSVHYRCNFISVLYNLKYFGTHTLLPSSLTTNSLLPLLKFGSPLHFYHHTLHGDTSNILPYSDWSHNESVLLVVG